MLRIFFFFTIQILALVSSRFNRSYTCHVVKEHVATNYLNSAFLLKTNGREMGNGVQCANTNALDQNMCMYRIIFFGETSSIHKTKGGHGIGNHVPKFLSLFRSRLRSVGKEVDYASFPFEKNFFFLFFSLFFFCLMEFSVCND